MTSGYTAELGEQDKHAKNDIPCTARGWVCVPLVVQVFGGWGSEAQEALSRVAKKLAIRTSRFWPEVLASIYCHLGITHHDAPECKGFTGKNHKCSRY